MTRVVKYKYTNEKKIMKKLQKIISSVIFIWNVYIAYQALTSSFKKQKTHRKIKVRKVKRKAKRATLH